MNALLDLVDEIDKNFDFPASSASRLRLAFLSLEARIPFGIVMEVVFGPESIALLVR